MGGNATAVNNTTVIINNNNSSPDAPTPNFIDILLKWINSLVQGSKFPITGDPAIDGPVLTQAVQSVAQASFLLQYGYAWNGNDTSPPSYNGGNIFQPKNDFTNCAQNQIGNISVYVDGTVYDQNADIPNWALKRMRSDLETWIEGLVKQPVIEGWQITPYTRFFTDPNGKENVRVDAQALYTIIKALDQNNEPQITMFLDFVGVYYGVGTTFEIVRPGDNASGQTPEQKKGY